MTLTPSELERLNSLLKDKDIDLPDFRREVRFSGGNYAWLQKHLPKRNPNLSAEMRRLLRL